MLRHPIGGGWVAFAFVVGVGVADAQEAGTVPPAGDARAADPPLPRWQVPEARGQDATPPILPPPGALPAAPLAPPPASDYETDDDPLRTEVLDAIPGSDISFDDLPPLPDLPPVEELLRQQEAQDPEGAAAQASGPGLQWFANPRAARERAMQEGRYLLLAFVGFNWNGLSTLLNREVFSTPGFANFAAEHLVCAYLDFPSNQNDERLHPIYNRFKDYCGVRGFPAVALFGPDGKQIGLLKGYRAGSSVSYLQDLKQRIEYDRIQRARSAADAPRDDPASLEARGFRTWRNREGRTIVARLTAVRGGRVHFEEVDGRASSVPIEVLHLADAELARRWARNGGRFPDLVPIGAPLSDASPTSAVGSVLAAPGRTLGRAE